MMQENQKHWPAKLNIWLPLLLAVVLVTGMLIGMRLQSEAPRVVDLQDNSLLTPQSYSKIEELMRYIEAKYVDEVDRDKLIDEAIANLLKQLDPHSVYFSAEQLASVNVQLEGNFNGIGVEFMILDDTVTVVAPLSGGPAESAGILAGDKIIEAGDSVIAGVGITSNGVIKLLSGDKGSKVSLGIRRGNETTLRRFTLERAPIPVHSVDVAYMLDDETGYIKINRFSAKTYEEFMQGLETLVEKNKMKDLVIDLRQNPGGYLQQATNILSQLFRDKNKLLVYTEGRSVHRNDYESTGRAFFEVRNIAVLIDEGSASASEILAGALQDHDRAQIIGRRSFGKGLVQEQYSLRDGSALRLTVARYYTPSGRSIQKPYSDRGEYEHDFLSRLESGELSGNGQIAVQDSTKYYTEKGRIVYGGGGITPDVFVPIDTTALSDYYFRLRQLAPQFVFKYVQNHRADFNYASIGQFKNNFRISDALLTDFVAYATQNGVLNPTDASEELRKINAPLRHYLKASFGQNLFDREGFYAVWNETDPMVRKALQTLRQPNPITRQ
ncbi:MAG TPA: S41 family peptidase [Saprospiraceae bacterium]|nr:S41 family peptidase [Saprospiraceae bacterium]HMP24760.1 S41 family peptidase [Saprospiraceae bacterium]